MKRIVLIFLAATALLSGCNSSGEGSGAQQGEPPVSSSQEDTMTAQKGSGEGQEGAGSEDGAEDQSGTGDGSSSTQSSGGQDEPVAEDETAAMAKAMLEILDLQGDMNYARLIDMDGDGVQELLVGTHGMDCWAWQWIGGGLSQVTLGGPIDRGNDGQMGGLTDYVILVQAPDESYGVLCQGNTDLTFYTYRFLDRTECYEDRVYSEWIDSPDYSENAPDPENYYYRNGENISKNIFETALAQYVAVEQISDSFDDTPREDHIEETRAALEQLLAA